MNLPAHEEAMAAERVGGLRLIRRVLAVLSVVVALNVLLTGWQFFRIDSAVTKNCGNIHKLVMTLDTILESGDAQTERYVQEGLLTPAQAERADRYRQQQRKVLAGADCSRGD